MLVKRAVIKVVAACAVMVGVAQADIIIHETTKWQSLGPETIADGGRTNSNNGVFWRIAETDAWNQLVTGTEFDLGQTVVFKVEVWKQYQGTHFSDVAKVWLDGTEVASGEWTLAGNGYKKRGYSFYDGSVATGGQTARAPKLLGSVSFAQTFNEARDYELIARTMCSDDLAKLVSTDGSPRTWITYVAENNKVYGKWQLLPTDADWAAFTSTFPKKTLQGEIERYTFNVKNVPEPTTLSLLGISLLGLGLLRRRNRK